jgi:hypothetical protein
MLRTSFKKEKSIKWMPRRQKAKKDVTGCDKLRGVVNTH